MNSKMNEFFLKTFSFSMFMTMAVIVSYFPLYFDYKGYSKLQIGMLYAIGPLIGMMSNLLWGFISDKYQTVKKVLMVLLTGQLITALLIFNTDWFALLYIFMGMFFFFQQPMTSMNDSQIMLYTSINGKSFASFRVWGSIGFAFAAGSFGLLLKTYGSGLTPALCLFTICLTLALGFTLKDARSGNNKMAFGGVVKIISSKKFLWFLFLIMVMSVAHRFNDGFLALYLRKLGAPDTIIGYSWMVSALSEIPAFFFLSKYGHRFKELPLLAFAGFVYFIRFLIMGYIHDPVYVVFVQILHSATFGIFLFTAIRYIGQLVPDEYRSSGQAIFAVTWSSAAGLISGTLGGWLFDLWGGGNLYLCGAGLALLSAFGFLGTHLWQKEVSFVKNRPS
jgi:PPP family 3-phenylpropionic acid transporter